MMTPEAQFQGPIRVSILERIVPSFGFAIAAISGALGAVMLLRFLNSLRQGANAGYATFFGGMAEIEFAVAVVLIFAVVFCAVGILISIIRLFTTNTTASPPGLLFLMAGLLCTVPPFALHYILHLMKGVVVSPDPGAAGGISAITNEINLVAYFAIGAAVVIAIVLLAVSFIPFSSRPGRKSSPIICLLLVEIVIVFLVGVYFWEARTSITERDKERNFYSSSESSAETPASNSYDGRIPNESELNSSNTSAPPFSNSGGKTVSGGVLNDKAIVFPQPPYPAAARAVRATGSVSVEVVVGENGEVVSATAVTGPSAFNRG